MKWAWLLIFAVLSSPTLAASCRVSSFGINFGTYDPFATAPAIGLGSASITCQFTGLDSIFGVTASIGLLPGLSGTYANRTLTFGAERLSYNLFVDVNHSTIFGNGTGGSSTTSVCFRGLLNPCAGNTGTNGQAFPVPIYASMPARQDVGAGTYADTITVTVTF